MKNARIIMEESCFNKKRKLPKIVVDKLPGYSCEKILGRGSFGTTVLMQKGNSGDKIALKVVENDKSPDFKNEEKILKLLATSCSKKRVLCYNRTFSEENATYFVTEFIDGESLGEHKFQSTKSFFGILSQIMESIKYIHSLNIVHFDIKPQNIMVDSKGKVKLIDFGGASLMKNNKFKRDIFTFYYSPQEYETFTYFTKKQAQYHDWYSFAITIIEVLISNPTQLKEILKINQIGSFLHTLKDLIKTKGGKI